MAMMGFCGSLSFLWFHDTILMEIKEVLPQLSVNGIETKVLK